MKIRRILSFFFLFTLILSLSAPIVAADEEEERPEPIEDLVVEAKAALLVDPTTDEVLLEQNADARLYPASLTKVMTTLLVLEAVDQGKLTMDQTLTVSASALAPIPWDASTAGLKEGEQLSVKNLLYCVMVVSANEACNVLAEAVAGSISEFVQMMNDKATALGCEDTHFVNTNGLHDPNHYTTAWDLYKITKAALEHEEFMTFADAPNFTLPATEFHDERTLYTTNHLLSSYRALGYVYSPAAGIKTGSTSDAGHCLISSASKNGRELLGIVLGAEAVEVSKGKTQIQSFTEMVRMFKWGFENFSVQTVISAKERIGELEVALSDTTHVVVQPAYDVQCLLPNDVLVSDLERTESYPSKIVDAPISEGDELGSVTISYEGKVYATVPLLAQNDVEASKLLVFRRNVLDFVGRTEVKIIAVLILVLIIALVILLRMPGRRRRRYGKGGGYGMSRNYRGRRRR